MIAVHEADYLKERLQARKLRKNLSEHSKYFEEEYQKQEKVT